MDREFPKMLYKGDAEFCIVDSVEEQKSCEAEGWHEFGKEPAKPKRGRPKKASD